MENVVYYLFCAMCLGGALSVILARGYVNAAMGMMLSMLGVAGLMVLMQAYFPAFIMVSVYAGSVLVLFVFTVMLMGSRTESATFAKSAKLVLVWALVLALIGAFFPSLAQYGASADAGQSAVEIPKVAAAKNYGYELFGDFCLAFEIAGVMLLAAIVGVISIAKIRHSNSQN